MANDIISSIDASDEDVKSMKKDHYKENPSSTRLSRPQQVQESPRGLNQQFLEMLKVGKTTSMFQGIERCIRVMDPGTPSAHHCLSMIVANLTTNERMCTRCTKTQNAGDPKPTIINSSMIRLSQRELEECGLDHDPLLNTKTEPAKKPAKVAKQVQEEKPVQRRAKVATPNAVKIEVTMKELETDPNIVNVLLQKALEAIYELPITKFSEAEAIRGTSEKIKKLLQLSDKGD